MTHLTEEDLVLLYYSEPGAPPHAATHLRECPECRGASESLARTLNSCYEWSVPDAPPELARSVWAQLAPQLAGAPRRQPRLRWAWALTAALALLIGAFYIGRASKRTESPLTAGLSDTARHRILEISLADHLDRAELLLTEISNVSDTGSGEGAAADLSSARSRAQDMVDEGRLMRQSLASQGETATLELLDEVERFMLEVANAPDRASPEEIHLLRQRLDAGSLLFKVRIIESNLRTEGQKI